mmetsp:Transcript_96113/g.133353  ORF Transcript_96113/g.133353 Transcript_96113/m.133353 type:complete len:277 (-) Transcript_96113:119-949(-)
MQKGRKVTTCWRANEVSLARDSFNSIVGRQKIDVTEVMMRHSNMGRQAEMGPSWCPSGLVSRQLAEVLAKRQGTSDKLPLRLQEARNTRNAKSSEPAPEAFLAPSPSPADPVQTPKAVKPMLPQVAPLHLDSTELPWASPVKSTGTSGTPVSPPISEQKAPEELPQPFSARARPTPKAPPESQAAQASRPMSAKCRVNAANASANSRNSRTTFCWRPNEHSLQRNSFNSMVGKSRLDVTEVMIRDASMGRQAEMGPSWCPGGLSSRKMAEALSQRR